MDRPTESIYVTDRSRLRLVVLGVLVISLVATLLGRLWYLQVLDAHAFGLAAHQNQVRDIVTQPVRGEVLDDMGRPFIDNKTALVISVDRTALEQLPDGGKAVLHRLSKLLGTPYPLLSHEIQECGKNSQGHYVKAPCWAGSPYQPIPVSQLKPSLSATMRALQIKERQDKFPGVSAQLAAVRHYPKPDGANASAILGYLTPISSAALAKLSLNQQQIQRGTEVGATGLEGSYQKYLRGHAGVKKVHIDHVGAVTGIGKITPPTPGDDVITNIDAKAQAALETQLQLALEKARGAGYTADYDAGVVMNVRTGGIVAMASDPAYDVSKPPSSYQSERKYNRVAHSEGLPFVDKAFGSAAPPGSTFKMISSSGLLWDGTMNRNQLYNCPTTFQHRHSFEHTTGAGMISLRDALIVSCDTFFFRLGFADWVTDNNLIKAGKKPREGVQHMARDYGLGENPNVDLPGAAWGHIGDRLNAKLNWEQLKSAYCKGMNNQSFSLQHRQDDGDYCRSGFDFRSGDQENEDVGQGTVDVSPLQLAVAYSALANGGTVFEPRVAKAILSPTGKLIKRIKAPVRDHIPLSQADQAYLRSALYGVTTSTTPLGTAHGAFRGFPMSQVVVGGKTGTAELSGTNQNGSWFASFGGPAGEKPQYVAVIEVDKSKQGAISAAPFVKNLWDDLYGLQGSKAIFPNGVPPTALPKVTQTGIGSSTVHKHVHHGNGSGSTSSPSPGTQPSSPSTTTAGLPPGLPVVPRSEAYS
jgi:penicillin-binding protein 2